jgi:WD40 repeat protein/actin-like ATPase involved in cell morphogenesis
MTTPWLLAVDFGTSFTVAAVRVGDRPPEVVEINGDRRVPSIIVVLPDGELQFGQAAETLSASNPGSTLRAMKARLGDASPVVFGRRPYPIVGLVSAFLEAIAEPVIEQMGSRPSAVRLTHPASWNQPLVQRFADAAAGAGFDNATLVPEPIAAAAAYAADAGLDADQCIVVYDLGGGTFDCAVVRGGELAVVGQASGDGSIGGELFDELMMNVIGEQLEPDVWNSILVDDDATSRRVRLNLRNEARRAKEALSSTSYVDVALGLPAGLAHLRLTRADFERIARPYLAETVAVTQQCVSDSGLRRRDLSAIALVGGASRSPLVEELIASAFPGTAVRRRGDPKASVAIGAALAHEMSGAHARSADDHLTQIAKPASTPTSAPEQPAGATGHAPPTGPPSRPPAPPITTFAPLPSPPAAPGPQTRTRARRRRTVVVAGVVAILAAVGATWAIVDHSARDDDTQGTDVSTLFTLPRSAQTTEPSDTSVAATETSTADSTGGSATDGSATSTASSTDGSATATEPKDPRPDRPWAIAPIVQSFTGHTSPVKSAVFSPDGSKLATGATDHTAKIWDVATGAMLYNLTAHTDDVNWVAFDPTGTKLVTASSDGTARIWSVETGEPLAVLQHDLTDSYFVVNTAEFSNDGTKIVTASNDSTARIWDASTGEQLQVLTHGSFVFTAWFSPDDATVLTASLDETAGVWSAASGELIHPLEGHSESVNGAAFSADGTMIVTASDDGTAKVWNASTGALVTTLKGHSGPVQSAAFSPDGARIVTSSDDRAANVWESTTGILLFSLQHPDGVRSAVFTPDGSEIVTISADYIGRIWDADDGAPVVELTEVVNDMSFSPDGRTIVTPSIGSASVVIWSVA